MRSTIVIWLWFLVLIGGLMLVIPDAHRATIATLDEPPTTVTLPVSPMPTDSIESTIDLIESSAAATAVAVRVDPPETTTTVPFDPVAYVNALPYQFQDREPAREAYRVVARTRGWDEATIARWERFAVDDVMGGESGWCWNVRGGARMSGFGCEFARDKAGNILQGRREDTGFFQLIRLWYEYPDGILCPTEGYCSSEAILASPFHSMNAGLAAIEMHGKQSWCYDARARSYHWSCATTPRNWP